MRESGISDGFATLWVARRLRDPTPSTHDFEGKVAYQYVREPLTAAEADRLANACETPTERLIVRTLLDTGLRISELCNLTARDVLWQQRQLRFKGKGGPYGKKSKVRVVPMSHRVRALMEHYFAL